MPTFRFRASSDGKAKREFCESNLRGPGGSAVSFLVEAVCCLLSAGLRAGQLVSDKKVISSRASLIQRGEIAAGISGKQTKETLVRY